MLRAAVLAIALVALGTGARAQTQIVEDPLSSGEPLAEAIDFILRPSQEEDDDFWRQQLEPELPDLDAPVGPPMAGPTGEERLGPTLAGPEPEPLRVLDEPEAPDSLQVPTPVRRPSEQADPFAPVGIHVGSFVIRPSIEAGVVATDNAAGAPEKEAAVGAVVEPEVNIRAETERYELEANLRGEAIFYDDEQFDDREREARLRARYDLTSRTSLEAEAAYISALESFTDPDTPDAAIERPGVQRFNAALGATQRFGRLEIGGRGFVERNVHEDVTLAGGVTASRDELDNTLYGTRVRTGYAISGALTPFADAAVGRREFDREALPGFDRSSTWGELRGGILLDLGSKLAGEAAVGYRREDLEGAAFDDIDAFVADAAILWSPRRLTEVRFALSTDTRPTTLAGASAAILYTGTVSVTHKLTPRIEAEVGAGIDHERFIGAGRQDTTYALFAGLSYAFTRTLSVKASYSYEQTESDDPGSDANANIIGVRVRIQR
jgi:hypothetical protein